MDGAALKDLFGPWGEVAVKRMFGGLGVFRDGLMFALVADGTLYFKVDENSRAAFEAEGGQPFRYGDGDRKVSLGYVTPPAAIFDDEDALKLWAGRAYAAALSKAALKRPPVRPG